MSFSPGNNSANFYDCAGYDGQNVSLTTVGGNGGQSYYVIFDQRDNEFELNDLTVVTGLSHRLRGSVYRSVEIYYLGFRLSTLSSVFNSLKLFSQNISYI